MSNDNTYDTPAQSPLKAIVPICPVCKSLDARFLCHVDGFDVWRCAESATDFVWPMPDPKVLKALYDREAWFEGGERGGYADYDKQTEPSLHAVTELLARFPKGKEDLTILDVGCGYGTHLRLAADSGWKCFGIEPSSHARGVAQERHGNRLTIVEHAEDLLPLRFDLVIMFEVIEHLQDPYKLFFTLFGRIAISPETLVVISTPNARGVEAVRDPGGWAYRHPPSHLVFYSAKSLQALLSRLLFKNIEVRGIVPLAPQQPARYDDEPSSINDDKHGFLGIVAEASGSDFRKFMHERFVPGDFWRLMDYEHLPRYALAKQLAGGMSVLDFGCGTGYGTALLGEVAESVVGMDIAAAAIKWAKETHRNPKLRFEERADLGRVFPQASFDLVTCFEMIEHVDHETQLEVIRSISALLKPGGKLIISTPDPQVTASYDENPYHIREMTESEFLELLREGFEHVTILRQWVRPSVLIGLRSLPSVGQPVAFGALSTTNFVDAPVGFVAICSNKALDAPPHLCQFDASADFNYQTLETEHKLNRLRFANYTLKNANQWLESQCKAWETAAAEQTLWLDSQRKAWETEAAEQKLWFESQSKAWTMPYHSITSANSLKPCSTAVGTSFSTSMRCPPRMPSAFNLPERICGTTEVGLEIMVLTLPPSTSITAGPAPL